MDRERREFTYCRLFKLLLVLLLSVSLAGCSSLSFREHKVYSRVQNEHGESFPIWWCPKTQEFLEHPCDCDRSEFALAEAEGED